MTTFIDTNVILEYVLQRERLSEAKEVITLLLNSGHKMVISAGSVYTSIFLIEKYLRKDLHYEKERRLATLRNIMQQILHMFNVAEHDNDSLLRSMGDISFDDLEDSCQYQVAQKAGCGFLITFNIADYPTEDDAPVKVLTPQQFINLNTNK